MSSQVRQAGAARSDSLLHTVLSPHTDCKPVTRRAALHTNSSCDP